MRHKLSSLFRQDLPVVIAFIAIVISTITLVYHANEKFFMNKEARNEGSLYLPKSNVAPASLDASRLSLFDEPTKGDSGHYLYVIYDLTYDDRPYKYLVSHSTVVLKDPSQLYTVCPLSLFYENGTISLYNYDMKTGEAELYPINCSVVSYSEYIEENPSPQSGSSAESGDGSTSSEDELFRERVKSESGTMSHTSFQKIQFSCKEIISYSGNIPIFDDYEKMLRHFREME